MNILVEVVNFGALSTYESDSDEYYILIFVYIKYTKKDEIIIDE